MDQWELRMQTTDVLVMGQIARDLVLAVDEVPPTGSSGTVHERREMLGGKGANQAVGAAQLGARVALLGVVGDDPVGDALLKQAKLDGIDVSPVVRRHAATSGLIAEVLDAEGGWRYLESLPRSVQLSEQDVTGVASAFARARFAMIQLQQPPGAVLTAIRLARRAGCRIVIDGVPNEADRAEVLKSTHVFRADAKEAQLMAGTELTTMDDADRFGRSVLRQGPDIVALAVDGEGNIVVWNGGSIRLPLAGPPPVDTTGAGDAFTAAVTVALHHRLQTSEAAKWAVAAAALTVRHPGGRPDLTLDMVRQHAAELPHA